MDPLSHDLERGVSTRADVHRLLGEPSGDGGFVLPPDHSPQDVWFYQEMRIKDFEAAQDVRENYVRMNMTHRILLVFFKGDVFDGYMWYSNAGSAEAKSR